MEGLGYEVQGERVQDGFRHVKVSSTLAAHFTRRESHTEGHVKDVVPNAPTTLSHTSDPYILITINVQ